MSEQTMSREKQIEEMARDIAETIEEVSHTCLATKCSECKVNEKRVLAKTVLRCRSNLIADTLMEKGYRKQEWISVAERLPEIMETVLIAYKEKWGWETEWHFDVDAGSWDIVEGRWNTYHDLDEGQELHITHWMPLPEVPRMKGGAE